MKKRPIFLLLLLLSLPALACNAPAQLPLDGSVVETATATALPATPTPLPPTPTAFEAPIVLEERIEYEDNARDQFRIDAKFPYLPNTFEQGRNFNRDMAAFVQEALAQFRSDAAQAALEEAPTTGSFLNTSYEVIYNEQRILSLRLWISYYMKGAAHPGAYARTFNYDLRTGDALALDDLFLPDAPYLDSLAAFCQAEIVSRDSAFWPDGAAADPANYANWNIREDGLLITFDEYQVAPYAAGPQEVLAPYAQFDGLLDAASAIGRVLP